MAAAPIVGVAADPTQGAEDWSRDFDFAVLPLGTAAPKLVSTLADAELPPLDAEGAETGGAADRGLDAAAGAAAVGAAATIAAAPTAVLARNGDSDSDIEDWDEELGLLQSDLAGAGSRQPVAAAAGGARPPGAAALAGGMENSGSGDYGEAVELLRQQDIALLPPDFAEGDDWDREMFGAADTPGNSRAMIAHGFRLLLKGSSALDDTDSKGSGGNAKDGLGGVSAVATPDSCRLAGQLLRGDQGLTFEIIRYPPACHLYSLRTGEGKGRALHGQRMVEWLQRLVAPKAGRLRRPEELRQLAEGLPKDLPEQERRITAATTKAFLDCASARWWLGEWEECCRAIRDFFHILKREKRGSGLGLTPTGAAAAVAAFNTLTPTPKAAAAAPAAGAVKLPAAAAPAAAAHNSDATGAETGAMVRHTIAMLELAALLPQPFTPVWLVLPGSHRHSTGAGASSSGAAADPLRTYPGTRGPATAAPSSSSSAAPAGAAGGGSSREDGRQGALFGDLVRVACNAFPQFRENFALAELRAAAHHLRAMMEVDDLEDCEYMWVAQGATPRTQYSPATRIPRAICANYIRVYARTGRAARGLLGSKALVPERGAAAPLTQRVDGGRIVLKSNGVGSGGTGSSCGSSSGGGGGCGDAVATRQPETPAVAAAAADGTNAVLESSPVFQHVAALTDLCFYLVGISPLTLEDIPEMLDYLPDPDDDRAWEEEDGMDETSERSATSDADSGADSGAENGSDSSRSASGSRSGSESYDGDGDLLMDAVAALPLPAATAVVPRSRGSSPAPMSRDRQDNAGSVSVAAASGRSAVALPPGGRLGGGRSASPPPSGQALVFSSAAPGMYSSAPGGIPLSVPGGGGIGARSLAGSPPKVPSAGGGGSGSTAAAAPSPSPPLHLQVRAAVRSASAPTPPAPPPVAVPKPFSPAIIGILPPPSISPPSVPDVDAENRRRASPATTAAAAGGGSDSASSTPRRPQALPPSPPQQPAPLPPTAASVASLRESAAGTEDPAVLLAKPLVKGTSFLSGFSSAASAFEQRVMGMVRAGSLPAVPTSAAHGSGSASPSTTAVAWPLAAQNYARGEKELLADGSERGNYSASCGEEAAAADEGVASGVGNGDELRKVPLLGAAPGSGAEPEEVDPRFLVRNLRDPEDARAYLEVLLPAYVLLPACCQQAARTAFAAGLLASAAKRHELAESLHLETVMALDRVPEEEAFAPSLLSAFGVHGLERLGDILLKNGKYEYGILALERAIDCFWEVRRRTSEHDKLIRKVTRITLEHEDMNRAIGYHVKMLRRARKGGNVNEFVYLAKEIGRMLAEQGAFLDAEQYLKVASRLVSGTPMSKVIIRDRQPITTAGGAGAAAAAAAGSAAGSGAAKGKAKAATVTAKNTALNGGGAGALKTGGVLSSTGELAAGAAAVAGGAAGPARTAAQAAPAAAVAGAKAPGQGAWPLGPLAVDGRPCLVPSVEVEDAGRNSYSWAGAGGLQSVATHESFGSLAPDRANLLTPTGSAPAGAAIETQQYELQMKLVDVFVTSLQHEKALKTLNTLLRRRIPAQQRSLVLLRVAECYLKLRRLVDCDSMLDKVVLEPDETVEQQGNAGGGGGTGGGNTGVYSSHGGSGGAADWRHTLSGLGILPDGMMAWKAPGIGGATTNINGGPAGSNATGGGGGANAAGNRIQAGAGSAAAGGGGGGGGGGGASNATGALWSVQFLVLRAKCRMAAGDALTALHWVSAALAVCADARQTNPLGRLHYLRGRCLQVMAVRAAEDSVGRTGAPSERPRKASESGPPESPESGEGHDWESRSPPALRSTRSRDAYSEVTHMTGSFSANSLRNSDDGDGDGAAGSRSTEVARRIKLATRGQLSEAELAEEAEDAYTTAHAHYRAADDVYYQAKCLARAVELQLALVFPDVVVRGMPLDGPPAGSGGGSSRRDALRAAEQRASAALELVGDVAAPLLLVLCLLNASELHWLHGRVGQAHSTWKEAQGLLCLTFLQRQDAAEYYRDKRLPPSSLPYGGLAGGTLTQHKRQRSSGGGIGTAAGAANARLGGSGGSGGGGSGSSPARSAATMTPSPPTTYGGAEAAAAAAATWNGKAGGFTPAGTPLRSPALPTVCHPPSVTLKLYHLLQRVVRMSFVLAGPPPAHCGVVNPTPLAAAALPSSTHLLAGWIALDGQVSCHAGPARVTHRRHHRRGRRGQLASDAGGGSGDDATRGGGVADGPGPHLTAPSMTSLSTAASGTTVVSLRSDGQSAPHHPHLLPMAGQMRNNGGRAGMGGASALKAPPQPVGGSGRRVSEGDAQAKHFHEAGASTALSARHSAAAAGMPRRQYGDQGAPRPAARPVPVDATDQPPATLNCSDGRRVLLNNSGGSVADSAAVNGPRASAIRSQAGIGSRLSSSNLGERGGATSDAAGGGGGGSGHNGRRSRGAEATVRFQEPVGRAEQQQVVRRPSGNAGSQDNRGRGGGPRDPSPTLSDSSMVRRSSNSGSNSAAAALSPTASTGGSGYNSDASRPGSPVAPGSQQHQQLPQQQPDDTASVRSDRSVVRLRDRPVARRGSSSYESGSDNDGAATSDRDRRQKGAADGSTGSSTSFAKKAAGLFSGAFKSAREQEKIAPADVRMAGDAKPPAAAAAAAAEPFAASPQHQGGKERSVVSGKVLPPGEARGEERYILPRGRQENSGTPADRSSRDRYANRGSSAPRETTPSVRSGSLQDLAGDFTAVRDRGASASVTDTTGPRVPVAGGASGSAATDLAATLGVRKPVEAVPALPASLPQSAFLLDLNASADGTTKESRPLAGRPGGSSASLAPSSAQRTAAATGDRGEPVSILPLDRPPVVAPPPSYHRSPAMEGGGSGVSGTRRKSKLKGFLSTEGSRPKGAGGAGVSASYYSASHEASGGSGRGGSSTTGQGSYLQERTTGFGAAWPLYEESVASGVSLAATAHQSIRRAGNPGGGGQGGGRGLGATLTPGTHANSGVAGAGRSIGMAALGGSAAAAGGGLEAGMPAEQRELWTCFCHLRMARRRYSSGKLSLRDLRSQNMETMQRIVELGRQLNRPISRPDRVVLGWHGGGSSVLASGSLVASLPEHVELSPQPIVHSSSGPASSQLTPAGRLPAAAPLPRRTSSSTNSGTAEPLGLGQAPVPPPPPSQRHSARAVLTLNHPGVIPHGTAAAASSGTYSAQSSSNNSEQLGQEAASAARGEYSSAASAAAAARKLHAAQSPSFNYNLRRHSFNMVALAAGGPGGQGAEGGAANGSAVGSAGQNPGARALRSRQMYPPTFHFVLFMDSCYMYYCPATGDQLLLPADRVRPGPILQHLKASADAQGNGPALQSCAAPPTQNQNTAGKNNPAAAASTVVLPLVPRPDEGCPPRDDAISVVVEKLPPQFAVFLVTALLLEQPVLLIASPGSEESLMYVSAGLLRLIRPFQWQHLHLPICHQSAAHLLKASISSREPFVIGTYPRVLESVCPVLAGDGAADSGGGGMTAGGRGGDSLSGSSGDVLTSFMQRITSYTETSHLTIVDLDSGIIHPAKTLEKAAAATMGASFAPDAEAAARPSPPFAAMRGERRGSAMDRSGSGRSGGGDTQLPPLPARYRHQLGQRIEAAYAAPGGGAGKRRQSTPDYQSNPFASALPGNGNDSDKTRQGTLTGTLAGTLASTAALDATTGSNANIKNQSRGTVASSSRGNISVLGGSTAGKTVTRRNGSDASGGGSSATTQSSSRTAGAAALAGGVGGSNDGANDATTAARCGETLRRDMFLIMVSMLKAYRLFLRPSAAGVAGGGYGNVAGHGGFAASAAAEMDREGLCRFAKDDVRPFLRVLVGTQAFQAFIDSSGGNNGNSQGPSAAHQHQQRGRASSSKGGEDLFSPGTASVSSAAANAAAAADSDSFASMHDGAANTAATPQTRALLSPVPTSAMDVVVVTGVSATTAAAGSLGEDSAPETSRSRSGDLKGVELGSGAEEVERSATPAAHARLGPRRIMSAAGDNFIHGGPPETLSARARQSFARLAGEQRSSVRSSRQFVAPPNAGEDGLQLRTAVVGPLSSLPWQNSSGSGGNQERFRERFEAAVRARMQDKLRLYSTVATERMGAFLWTYFAPHPHMQPQGPAGSAGDGQGGGWTKTSGVRIPKVKRRWCVLDATRLTYYRSRNKRRVKGHVPMDPRTVTLVTPPFTATTSQSTSEHHRVALMCANMPPEMGMLVVRAEQLGAHERWLRALKARLMPKELYAKMSTLYGS